MDRYADAESKEEKSGQVFHTESDTLFNGFPFHSTADRPNPNKNRLLLSNTIPVVLLLKNMEPFATKCSMSS